MLRFSSNNPGEKQNLDNEYEAARNLRNRNQGIQVFENPILQRRQSELN